MHSRHYFDLTTEQDYEEDSHTSEFEIIGEEDGKPTKSLMQVLSSVPAQYKYVDRSSWPTAKRYLLRSKLDQPSSQDY